MSVKLTAHSDSSADASNGASDSRTTRLELRLDSLSVSRQVQAARPTQATELPTIWTVVKRMAARVATGKSPERHDVLKGVSGVLRPGTMTLVLGQPGSGKSTLLQVLSGRLRADGDRVQVTGGLTYNGEPQQAVAGRLAQLAAYVPQLDLHFPLLTVQETLAFAHAFSGGDSSESGDNQTDTKQAPDAVKAQLGLVNCWDTVVGDDMVRGVSGGERKRVTMGEMMFGNRLALFMDEISTGLDSATTFDIVSAQRASARSQGKTVVMALLQPPPDVFALFDDVILLHDGDVLYFGPCAQAGDYFRGLGLTCPPERDIADFLLDLGTPQQSVYEQRYPTPTSLGLTKVPRLVSEYVAAFQHSDIHRNNLRLLAEPSDAALHNDFREYIRSTPAFQRSILANTLTLVRRQLKLVLRDGNTLRSRVVLVLVIALVWSTTFMNTDPTNAQVTLGVLFMSALFPLFEQTSQLAMFVSMREVFYKQRKGNFFQTSAYVLATAISQIPVALPESFIFGAFLYWIAGLDASAGSFIVFELVIFLNVMAAVLIFFFATAISPNIYVTNPLALGILQLVLVFAGFIVTRSQIPSYLIWIYWFNPLAWAFRALAVNQYRSAALDVCVYDGVDYCSRFGRTMGEYYLSVYDIPSDKVWVGFGFLYLLGIIALFMTLSFLALEYKRYDDGESPSRTPAIEETDDYHLVTTPTSSGVTQAAVRIDVDSHHKLAVTPVAVAFMNLWYSVPNPTNPKESIDLLKGVSGFALPGTITALMGSSGAGKTTLLDVIAGRKTTGTIRGEILLNGHKATELAIRRCTGYCEQMDVHSETATIREALTFSAFLRQSSDVPAATKLESVDECLDLLGLRNIADQIVRGSSLEQTKRLTIGVELAARPSVLFLDEPTSGLDARLAKLVMDGVRKVADSGRTVICTIHQPSFEVFAEFDRLLLLQRGGKPVFFGDLGENCRVLVDYFEAIEGVPALPEGYNPASWMLECIGAGVNTSAASSFSGDFAQIFQDSEMKRQLDATIAQAGIGCPSPSANELVFRLKRASSSMTQFKFLLGRFVDRYWRSPAHNLTILGVALASLLVLGLVSLDLSNTSYQGVSSGLGIIFVAFQFQGFVSFNSAIPFAFADRAVFYRERSAETYNSLWYFVAGTLVEVPYVVVKSLIISAILFLFMGVTGVVKFVLFWLAVSFSVLIDAYIGHLLAFALPNVIVASLTGSVISSVFFLFVGFNPPGNAIPAGYQWLYTLTPHRYAMSILGALVYGDCSTTPVLDAATGELTNVGPERGCQPLENAPASISALTVKALVEDVYGFEHDEIARNFGALVAFVVAFRLLTLLALRFLNHQKR